MPPEAKCGQQGLMERAWGGSAWAEAASEAGATRTPKAWQHQQTSGREVLEGGAGAPVCPTLHRSLWVIYFSPHLKKDPKRPG